MRLTSSLLIAVTTLGLLSGSASAELVRFDIAGTLASKTGLEPIPATSPAIGSSFTGSFVFNTAAISTSGSLSFGVYSTPVPPGAVALKVGEWEWNATSQSPTSIVIWNNRTDPVGTQDSYEVGHSRLDFLSPGEPNPIFAEYWLFQRQVDGPSNIFINTDLPRQAFSLTPWTTNRWSISQWGTPPAPLLELTGTVTSFTSVVVPEPSSILSAAGSLWAFLLILGRRAIGRR